MTGTGGDVSGICLVGPSGEPARQVPAAVAGDLLRQCLAIQGECSASVVSGSMSPLVCCGDTVFVRAVGDADIAVGDLLLVCTGDALVTHRVIGRYGSAVRLKGDANRLPDPPVELAAVIGRVRAVGRRKGGQIDLEHSRVCAVSRTTAAVSGAAGEAEFSARETGRGVLSAAAVLLRIALRACVLALRIVCFFARKRGLPKKGLAQNAGI